MGQDSIEKHKDFHDTSVYRQNYYLWMFISCEGLWEDTREFIDENMDTPVPFEQEMTPKKL